ncbi:MAG: hypothetical protein ABI847_05500, partial [Anaerolineales bacterium]
MSTWLVTHRPVQIVLAVLAALLLPTAALVALAYSLTDIPGPAGSGYFGQTVTVLSNGNFVVTDPRYDNGVVTDVGAVYLYDGVTHQLISALVGSTAGDQVGSHGIISLTNSNYVVRSPLWSNGVVTQAGAVTVCSGTTGCQGTVTTTNSLVGSTAFDNVGSAGIEGVTALSNGNFVVASASWDNGAANDAGAATWCSGTAGCTGPVTTTNSLVGSQALDYVGQNGITALSNGHYVVASGSWHNDADAVVGAVTWCSGTSGCQGAVTTSNSLVGSAACGQAGNGCVTALSNGNYVVFSPDWNNIGAVTWCNGTVACTGIVTTSNSLVSSTPGDFVDLIVIPLSNGNYVVDSYYWQNGAVDQAGAVTWCSGTLGCQGVVTTTNSLVGST